MNLNEVFDIVVIGGGINGTAIAADAAGRGLSVLLCEAEDLANGTSSASSKMIHGGLRYLEQYQFHLVQEALKEREILLQRAPHNIKPLRFILPNNPTIRSPWLIRLGLFLYDHLARKHSLQKTQTVNLRHPPYNTVFKEKYKNGFSYFDCWADDSRLVILNALCAHEKGAKIKTRTTLVKATRDVDIWKIQLEDKNTGNVFFIYSKALINAAGPWADEILTRSVAPPFQQHISWVKGSHIIVPQIPNTPDAFILQHTDRRVIFILPYLNKYSLIGTTDVEYQGNLADVKISEGEIAYLLNAVNNYLEHPLCTSDIINSYAGVRALATTSKANPAELTRGYTLDIIDEQGKCPLLSVFGGKITTHRQLAEYALNKLKIYFPTISSSWTRHHPLPGGDIPCTNFQNFLDSLYQEYSLIDRTLIQRYAHQFGTRIHQILKHTNNPIILGENIGNDLYESEVEYLINTEWAQTAEDILWRRTKLGLNFPNDKICSLQKVIAKIFNKNI